MSAVITAQIARPEFWSQSILTSPGAKIDRAAFSGPSSWKIMKKMKPETAGTTIMGSRKNTVTMPRPLNVFNRSRASAKPRANSTPTATTVIQIVRPIASQNPTLVSASQ